VRAVELADACSFLTPGLEELAVCIEFHDASIVGGFLAVAVGYEDVAIRSNGDFGGLIKGIETRASNASLSESQQDLTVVVELEDLLPLAVLYSVVGNPEMAVVVYGDFVRTYEQSLAKALQELAGGIELQNGIERRLSAVGAARTVRSAAIDGPDVAIRTDGDAGRGAPFSPAWEHSPAHSGKIGIWEIVASAKGRSRRRLLCRNRRVSRTGGGLRTDRSRRGNKGSNRHDQGSGANDEGIHEVTTVHGILSLDTRLQILPPTIESTLGYSKPSSCTALLVYIRN